MRADPKQAWVQSLFAERGICPQCERKMTVIAGRASSDGRRLSRDHILPRARGGRDVLFGDTRNLRTMCQDCNALLAACGHCLGAVACVRDEAARRHVPPSVIVRQWKMTQIWQRAEQAECIARKIKAKSAVAIGQKLQQCDLDEFAFPAETPAARVWNLATLARRGKLIAELSQ